MKVVATSIDACSSKDVDVVNDVAAAKGVTSVVADAKDTGDVEDFNRI